MRDLAFAHPRVADATYLELVRTLFSTAIPSVIMSILFLLVAGLCVTRTPDPALVLFAVAGSLTSAARVLLLVIYSRRAASPAFTVEAARLQERSYSRVYVAFAILLGLFTARTAQVSPDSVQVVTASLLVGYAAGVAAGVSLRPRISLAAVSCSVIPSILAAAWEGGATHSMHALVLSGLLAGGITSMRARYRAEAQKISMRHLLASLVRQDQLTGLANRLALQEAFERQVLESEGKRLALHCLDLDGFKPINDTHGHPTGDLVLKMVGERLSQLARENSLAVRLGGDEFAFLQTAVGHRDEADLMSRRIARALCEPYRIEGREITIGVSTGYALSAEHGPDLPALMIAADQALYHCKSGRRQAANQFAAASAVM